jgi:hypothetical protein
MCVVDIPEEVGGRKQTIVEFHATVTLCTRNEAAVPLVGGHRSTHDQLHAKTWNCLWTCRCYLEVSVERRAITTAGQEVRTDRTHCVLLP